MADTDTPTTDATVHRQLAVDLFNHVWTLMGKPDRTREQDTEMIHAAHASRHHWGEVGTPVNVARGEWQVSRVYTVVGLHEAALHHARRCLDVCEKDGLGDWDLAYAYEAMARAYGTAGAAPEAEAYKKLPSEVPIAADDDREHLEADLTTL